MRGRFLRAAALAGVLAAGGCGRPATPSSPPARRLDTVKIATIPTLGIAPIAIAKEEGFFVQEGIDLQILNVPTSEALIAMTAGKIDVAAGPIRSGMFNMMTRGEPLRIVAEKGHSSPGGCTAEAIVGRTAVVEKGLKTPADFRGLRVNARRGSTIEYLMDAFLTSRGVPYSSVVRADASEGDLAVVLKEGAADIRYAAEPNLSMIVGDGTARILAPAQELEPGRLFSAILFGRHLLVEDRELGRRFIRAYLRGVQQYSQGKTPRNVDILARYTKLPAARLRDACWIAISPDGRPDVASVQRFIDWGRKRKYIDAEVPEALWWDPFFVESAKRNPSPAAAPARP